MKAHMQARAGRHQRNLRAAGSGARALGGALHGAETDEFDIFSDRLDEAEEYERIMKEFEALHAEARSAESYS